MIDRRRAAAAVALAALARRPALAQLGPADAAPALARWLASKGVGLAAAQVGSGGVRYAFAGRRDRRDDGTAPDKDTLWAIGSISKVCTGLLLADAAVRGEVALDEPAERMLPSGPKLRDAAGEPVRLLDLATHRSGLPRAPSAPQWYERADPFTSYAEPDLLRWLAAWKPEVARDTQHAYSNLGPGLLGWLLARRAQRPYMALLRERVLDPLGLVDVHLGVPPSERARLAPPHRADGRAAVMADFGVLAPAAGLVASAAALARFAQGALGLLDGEPLRAAFDLALRPWADGPDARTRMGIAWFVSEFAGRLVYRHDGAMPGHSASLVVHPSERRAALVLGNANIPVDDLAWHLLDARLPLRTP